MGLSQTRYLELHKRFLAFRRSNTDRRCKILDYKAFDDKSEGPYSGPRMRVVQDANTGVNELLNWTNHFGMMIEDYNAWTKVLEEIEDDEERLSTVFEIISPVSFFALSFPAAIRGKLVFVCARIIRDTFSVKKSDGNPVDDYLLNEKKLKSLVKAIDDPSLTAQLDAFVDTLAEVDGKSFREVTSNYRNRANHGITPNIEVGERMAFAPMSGKGIEGFTFGVEKAIKLSTLIDPLVYQHMNCTNSIEAFWPVVVNFRKRWKVLSA